MHIRNIPNSSCKTSSLDWCLWRSVFGPWCLWRSVSELDACNGLFAALDGCTIMFTSVDVCCDDGPGSESAIGRPTERKRTAARRTYSVRDSGTLILLPATGSADRNSDRRRFMDGRRLVTLSEIDPDWDGIGWSISILSAELSAITSLEWDDGVSSTRDGRAAVPEYWDGVVWYISRLLENLEGSRSTVSKRFSTRDFSEGAW